MSTSYWLDRSSYKKKQTYDVVIVGAGIAGLSTAYWLNKEDSSLKIAIVEKNRLGFGASGRNAGFVTCGSVEHFNRMISKHGMKQAVEIWNFAAKNMTLLKEHIIQSDGEGVEFEQRGAYSLAANQTEFKELSTVAKIMSELKIPNEIIDSDEVQKRVGAINFAGGIKYCDDGAVHPVKLLELMLSRVKADLYEQTYAHRYEISDNGTRILKTDSGDFEAPMLIYCLNGYAPTMHPYFSDKVYPTRAQILMMEPIPLFMDGPCYANFYLDYFRQMPNGSLLIGGFRQLEKTTEVGYSDHTTDIIQNALHEFVQTHLPALKNKKVSHRWGGVMGFSKDGEPQVGSLPDDPQVFFCGAFTGHGIGLAFHTAKKTVDLIFGREIPSWLSARRFS